MYLGRGGASCFFAKKQACFFAKKQNLNWQNLIVAHLGPMNAEQEHAVAEIGGPLDVLLAVSADMDVEVPMPKIRGAHNARMCVLCAVDPKASPWSCSLARHCICCGQAPDKKPDKEEKKALPRYTCAKTMACNRLKHKKKKKEKQAASLKKERDEKEKVVAAAFLYTKQAQNATEEANDKAKKAQIEVTQEKAKAKIIAMEMQENLKKQQRAHQEEMKAMQKDMEDLMQQGADSGLQGNGGGEYGVHEALHRPLSPGLFWHQTDPSPNPVEGEKEVAFMKGLASSILGHLVALVQCMCLHQAMGKLDWLSNLYFYCHFGQNLKLNQAYVNIQDDGRSDFSLIAKEVDPKCKEAMNKAAAATALDDHTNSTTTNKFESKVKAAHASHCTNSKGFSSMDNDDIQKADEDIFEYPAVLSWLAAISIAFATRLGWSYKGLGGRKEDRK